MDGPTWDFPDFFEITNNCEIHGCFAMLLGDTRCTTHGGHPKMESQADAWGESAFTVVMEGQSGTTTET